MADHKDLPAELWTLVFGWLTRSTRAKGDLACTRVACRRFMMLIDGVGNLIPPVKRKVSLLAVPISDCLNSASRAEWLLSHRPQKWWEEMFDKKLLAKAAEAGSLEVVKLLRGRGHRWDKWTCANAANGGHLEVLKWARANGCPWDEQACMHAAWGGHLEVLKWARSQDPPCPWNRWTCANAAQNGHLKVLKWARSQDPPCPWDECTCELAAQNGHLEVLKWARSQDPPCPWDVRTCANAAWGGHLDVLKWARDRSIHEQTCPWDRAQCLHWAQENNHAAIVDWITAQGTD